MKLFLAVCLFHATTSQSSEAPFKNLKCKSILSDNVKITTSTSKNVLVLSLDQVRRKEPNPLIRAVASPKIPDRLLASYYRIRSEIIFPLNSCTFFSEPIGNFKCNSKKPVPFTIEAETFEDEIDKYKGELSSATLTPDYYKHTETKTMFYGLDLEGKVNRRNVSIGTTGFFAAKHSADGNSFDPECMVDGEHIEVEDSDIP